MDLYKLCFLVLLPAAFAAECQNALEQAMDCTKRGAKQKVIIEGNYEKAVKDCRERYHHKSVDCLEDVMERCKNDKVHGETLKLYIDVDNTRKSVNYLCENLGALKSHGKCIKNVHQEVVECTKLRVMQPKKDSSESTVDRICQFTRISLDCFEKVLDSRCGEEANNFLYNVMAGPLPPICKQLNDNGTTRTQSFCLTVFMSMVTVLLSFMLR
ncbi:uncharacterized protein LOC106875579 [Octopus bimaculoides]|uniref:uncharacterized protein LOC106875579 n=1 Tax=Octopus bimaculoides TaxID=37653 RepID=UPI00071E3ED4|nr:uncharacterized protein LOC106875579 [Octopus bimaculoides]|eukprot:XP_014779274.1 PREDICTED: uncharacterized protein LOC106875579 [Octopus bimaculoides]